MFMLLCIPYVFVYLPACASSLSVPLSACPFVCLSTPGPGSGGEHAFVIFHLWCTSQSQGRSLSSTFPPIQSVVTPAHHNNTHTPPAITTHHKPVLKLSRACSRHNYLSFLYNRWMERPCVVVIFLILFFLLFCTFLLYTHLLIGREHGKCMWNCMNLTHKAESRMCGDIQARLTLTWIDCVRQRHASGARWRQNEWLCTIMMAWIIIQIIREEKGEEDSDTLITQVFPMNCYNFPSSSLSFSPFLLFFFHFPPWRTEKGMWCERCSIGLRLLPIASRGLTGETCGAGVVMARGRGFAGGWLW